MAAVRSDPRFRVLHGLRIKGFAKQDVLAELAGLSGDELDDRLTALQRDDLAVFREARALWQLTPAGREAHATALAADVGDDGLRAGLREHYGPFLKLNEEFKELCGQWQLREGRP